jgi:hypothetical protein
MRVIGSVMVSAGARTYMGVWGLSPQWGPGAKPLVGGQEADAFLINRIGFKQ